MHIWALALSISVLPITAAIALGIRGDTIPCSREGGLQALSYLADWAKWMTGLETAALGGLTLLVFGRGDHSVKHLTPYQADMAWCSLLFLGSALIVSGWVLASFPSLSIRLFKNPFLVGPQAEYDVMEQQIYAKRSPRLGFLVNWHHWLWGLGLASIAAFAVSLFVARCSGA
jgi:hypothetical protein